MSSGSFLANLGRSNLLEEGAYDAIVEDLWAEGMEHESDDLIAAVLVERGEITHWQAERLLSGKFRGFTLGEYRLLDLLGTGGMGSVYLAEHSKTGRRLAIKVLTNAAHEENADRLQRFRREAETIAHLSHHNIVKAFEIQTPNDDCNQTYLVMELVEGATFQQLVAECGPLKGPRTAAYLIQACRALQHAHSLGYIHRDVKPSNLMVRRDGVVKLLDLGLASSPAHANDPAERDDVTAFVGTADYVSPEQARNNHRIDSRSDIYSLGCTAYFLLTGRPPFVEKSVASRLVAHQMYEPTSLESLCPQAPAELLSIVNRMMAKEASLRYSSASEAEQALQTFLDQAAPQTSVEMAPPNKAAEVAVSASASGEPTIRAPRQTGFGNNCWVPMRAALGVVISWFSLFSTR